MKQEEALDISEPLRWRADILPLKVKPRRDEIPFRQIALPKEETIVPRIEKTNQDVAMNFSNLKQGTGGHACDFHGPPPHMSGWVGKVGKLPEGNMR